MTSKELKELKKFSAQIRVDELEMFRQRGMAISADVCLWWSSFPCCMESR